MTKRLQYTVETTPPNMHGKILVACRLAHRFAKRLPTSAELISEFGMSKPTSYRWIAAMREARINAGEAA